MFSYWRFFVILFFLLTSYIIWIDSVKDRWWLHTFWLAYFSLLIWFWSWYIEFLFVFLLSSCGAFNTFLFLNWLSLNLFYRNWPTIMSWACLVQSWHWMTFHSWIYLFCWSLLIHPLFLWRWRLLSFLSIVAFKALIKSFAICLKVCFNWYLGKLRNL